MRVHATTRLLCVLLIANLVAGPLASGQQSASSPNTTAAATPKQPSSTFGSSLTSVLNSSFDLGDYVPCEFTIEQLRNYRPVPATDYLTPYEAEAVKESVAVSALASSNSSSFTNGDATPFVQVVGNLNLDGRTKSEALAAIIATLGPYQAQATQTAAYNAEPNPAKKKAISDLNINGLSSTQVVGRLQELTKEVEVTEGSKVVVDFQLPKAPDHNPQTGKSTTGATKDKQQSSPSQGAGQTATTTTPDPSVAAAQQTAQDQTKSGQAIVESARNTIAAATRPLDVGCAMAILSWREVQVAFGRSVANEYIGVQVVVRNLNPDKQFLIHDAELAVDADLNGRLGRFYSGRDQKIVRQMSVAQQTASVRNLVVNIFGAVGTVASAAMPFAGPSFKDATGVYNSGFLSALAKTWPDHSIDQLNLLNDVGFSASTDSKEILVPKSGAAMFVMFVPSKQFEEGWWNQECAHQLPLAKTTSPPVTQSAQISQPSATTFGSETTASSTTTTSTETTSTTQTTPSPQSASTAQTPTSSQTPSGSQPPPTPQTPTSPQPASAPQAAPNQPPAPTTPPPPLQAPAPLQSSSSTQTKSTSVMTSSAQTTPIEEQKPSSQTSPDSQTGQSSQPRSPSTPPAPKPPPAPVSPSGQVGIDLQMAQLACGQVISPSPNAGPSPARKKYHDWSPTADAIFRELAFAVVAGTHITEANSTKPTIASLDCKKDKLGNVDFTQQVNGSVTCPVAGTNLDKVNKLKLRDAADATDNTTADGSVTVSGDTTKGNVDFPLAQIGPLQKPDYKVYAVAADGTETDANQTLHFDVTTPYFVSVASPTGTIALAAPEKGSPAPTTTVQISGYHLDKIGKDDKISLGTTSAAAQPYFSFDTTTALTASFKIGPGTTPVAGDGKLELWFIPSGKNPTDTKLSVTVSGMSPAVPSAALAKPAPPPKKTPTATKKGTQAPPNASGHQ